MWVFYSKLQKGLQAHSFPVCLKNNMALKVSRYIVKVNINFHLLKKSKFSTSVASKNRGNLVIECKRKNYNFYSNDNYGKLDEVPLASKGWRHSKSKDDCFIIRPQKKEFVEEMVPFDVPKINSELQNALQNLKIQQLTSFQANAFHTILQRKHTVLAAETGCGKTISYLLPIINSLIGGTGSKSLNSPKAVILIPNRELVNQIGEVATELAKPFGLNVKVVTGGRTKKLMMNPEFTEIDILVGTPGALGKLSTVGIFNLNNVIYTVLDEADTLLDVSFEERMQGILKRVPQSQIILVSATLPKSLPPFLQSIESNLHEVISPNIHKPLTHITQHFLRLTRSVKPAYLINFVKANNKPMIVFTNKNETCNWLAMFLRENNIPCANINGDMNYAIRIQQWDDFLQGRANILSATDIGSRGLNTVQIDHVLNYDFPLYAADYLHRVGRIGRLGSPKSCKVTNFITGPLEVSLVQKIELAVRRGQPLEDVDGNITRLVQNKIKKRMREAI